MQLLLENLLVHLASNGADSPVLQSTRMWQKALL